MLALVLAASVRTTASFVVASFAVGAGGATTGGVERCCSVADDADSRRRRRRFLKDELSSLAEATSRGFDASRSQRRRVAELVEELSRVNPTAEPAAAYYPDSSPSFASSSGAPTLSGKWTLVYTDAPDITSLRPPSTGVVVAAAELGRIGQECDGPTGTIANVIEWTPPVWVPSFLKGDRALQRVRCGASASPDAPDRVTLTIEGLSVEVEGGAVASLPPLDLRGFLSLPFGEFRVLYLDDELRAVRTSQGYLAVNARTDEWF